jgi:hypothetical protein
VSIIAKKLADALAAFVIPMIGMVIFPKAETTKRTEKKTLHTLNNVSSRIQRGHKDESNKSRTDVTTVPAFAM